jgi:carboxyl-terminal processing protease
MKIKLFIVILIAFVGGMLFQANNPLEASIITLTVDKAINKPAEVDFTAFWKVWQLVNQNFVATATTSAKVTNQTKIFGATQGMIDSLGDPYSVFLAPDENKMFADEIRGNFGGVGMEIGVRNKFLTVISPLPNTPAKKAGIEAGDKIVEIDGQSAFKMNVEEAIKLIRGEVGTEVAISVIRGTEDQSRVFKMTRAVIEIPTIESKNLAGGITQIKLFNFGATASAAFAKAIRSFAKSGNKYLILDLRGNPGGYMESAIDIASWFLPKGTPVMIEERGRGGETKIYPSAGHKLFTVMPKMVILVDEGSASASEIVAGALSENETAKLVGEQTFGKGSVQELYPITKDTSLKLTIARWLTPKGISISKNGLKPDYEVKLATSTDPLFDSQLDKAIEIVKKIK